MEAIFDNEQQKELRAGTFNVNLGKEDGLAGIIIDVREAAEYLATYGDLSEGDPNYDAKKKAIIDIFELEVEETT